MTFLDMSWDNPSRKIIPGSIEHTDSEKSLFLWSIFQLFSLTKLSPIAQCSGITLRAGGLYESFSATGFDWNPRIAQTSKNVERANNSREWSSFSKSWSRSFSGCRIFLDLSLSESETTYPNLKFGRSSAKSAERISRYPYFCENIFRKSLATLRHDLP